MDKYFQGIDVSKGSGNKLKAAARVHSGSFGVRLYLAEAYFRGVQAQADVRIFLNSKMPK